jgi:hypothetical protein
MPALRSAEWEAVAQALAKGGSIKDALEQGGLSGSTRNYDKVRGPEITARVAALREAFEWGAEADPALEKLAELAAAAAKLNNASGLLGAGKLVVEIARLRERMGSSTAEPAALPEQPPIIRQLSAEEWDAKYGPKD